METKETKALYEKHHLPLLINASIMNPVGWEKQRETLQSLLEQEVVGRAPYYDLTGETFRTVREALLPDGNLARHFQVCLPGRDGTETVLNGWLYLPKQTTRPLAAMIHIGHVPPYNFDTGEIDTRFFPFNTLLNRGYAALTFRCTDAVPDEPRYDSGLWRSVYGTEDERKKSCWGAIRAWGWAASRMLDYLTTLPEVNEKKVAIVGHSRLGKAALWAGAMDTRFSMVISKDSGSGGAALMRGNKLETIADLNRKFPHWYAPSYADWNNREYETPFDAHTLLSLIAPRHLYISSATNDPWADPVLEFAAESAVTPIYRLYDLAGLGDGEMPPPDKPLFGQHMAYHIRTGGHSLTAQDFQWYCDYADRVWN
ncbi:MAG: acetylxylan esterase [Christensenellales bacterium]|jgi:hypothetical protein